MLRFLDHSVNQRFVKPEHRANLIVESDAEQLLSELRNYKPLKVDGGKWINELKENEY
jgi:predicted Rossmann-fold nucleotide-binding protein